MTKVKINPGVCGLITEVEAVSEDGLDVTLKIRSGCKSVHEMLSVTGDTFDSYELCLKKPGEGALYDYAKEHFPGHASCPVIAGVIKAAEVECKLALPKTAEITFAE